MSILILPSVSDSKSPPFVVSAILNFLGSVQSAKQGMLIMLVIATHYLSLSHLRTVTKKPVERVCLIKTRLSQLAFGGLSFFFLNSKRYRTMLQISFSEQQGPPTSLLCFILFTGYLLSRGSNTNCLCFKIISHQAPIRTSSSLHSFPAALVFYRHPSVQNTILLNKVLWSALFFLPGSSYLEPTPCFCPPSTSVLCRLF